MIRLGLVIAIIVTVVGVSLEIIPADGNEVLNRLNEKKIYPKHRLLPYQDSLEVSVMLIGNPSKSTLLLVHGSPGDWSAWENIIANDSIRDAYYIVAIDRAGYGQTTVPALKDLDEQAAVVWSAMNQLGIEENITLAGHSYGVAVIEQLMVEHKDAFELGVFVAGTLSPDLMSPRWYNKVAKWKIVNYMLSKDMKSSNIEMMGLPESLHKNEDQLRNITAPIIYIQGMEDVLVPFETVDYFKSVKPQGVSYIIIDDMNHFTPWSDPYLITDALLGKPHKR